MLRGLNPLLTGELLAHLDALGHGDLVAIVDANFPARTYGRRVVEVVGADAPTVARAIFTVAPPDAEEPIAVMAAPDGRRAVHELLIDSTGLDDVQELGRQEFYALAAQAELVVRTSERRGYGNLLVRMAAIAS